VSGSTYLMENGSEAERLEAKTEAHVTERLLSLAGLSPGMRALDAGAGTGAVARVMSRMVGSSGSVVAADRSAERLQHGQELARQAGIENLAFLTVDLEEGSIQAPPFDFVWCRFVFEYLRDPDRTLANLVASTRIGGKIVVADLDGNAVFHHPCPPEVESGLTKVIRVLDGRFDPYAGRKLFARFRRQRLANVQVHAEAYHLYAGTAPESAMKNWAQKLTTIRPAAIRAFESEAEFDRWAASFLELLRDPDSFTYSVLVLVEGTRTS
jgi:ubiquinone/menaquinone biosynthesis C-methylase UbiE